MQNLCLRPPKAPPPPLLQGTRLSAWRLPQQHETLLPLLMCLLLPVLLAPTEHRWQSPACTRLWKLRRRLPQRCGPTKQQQRQQQQTQLHSQHPLLPQPQLCRPSHRGHCCGCCRCCYPQALCHHHHLQLPAAPLPRRHAPLHGPRLRTPPPPGLPPAWHQPKADAHLHQAPHLSVVALHCALPLLHLPSRSPPGRLAAVPRLGPVAALPPQWRHCRARRQLVQELGAQSPASLAQQCHMTACLLHVVVQAAAVAGELTRRESERGTGTWRGKGKGRRPAG